jgi:hypothetical protein
VLNRVTPKIIAYHLRQIVLNQTLLRKFKTWCKFSSPVKVKSHKKKLHTWRPACIVYAVMESTQSTYHRYESGKQNFDWNTMPEDRTLVTYVLGAAQKKGV